MTVVMLLQVERNPARVPFVYQTRHNPEGTGIRDESNLLKRRLKVLKPVRVAKDNAKCSISSSFLHFSSEFRTKFLSFKGLSDQTGRVEFFHPFFNFRFPAKNRFKLQFMKVI